MLAGAGVLALWLLSDPRKRELQRVERRLQELAETVSFAENDPVFRRLGYPQNVVEFFTTNVQFDVELSPRQQHELWVGRDQLLERATVVRAGVRGLRVQFLDPEVRLGEDLHSATAHLTSKIYITGESDYIVQEFRLALVKPAGTWLVRKVETVKTME